MTLPAGSGDPNAEHLATRRAAGLFDFSFMSMHEIAGPQAMEYLCDIQSRSPALLPGRIAYTLLLERDGRVFIDATLWRRDAHTWWLFTGRRSDHAWLARRAAGFGVELRERSGELAVIALQGPSSPAVLAAVIGEERVRALRYFHFSAFENVCIGRIGYSGELGYELLVPAAHASEWWSRLLTSGPAFGVRECSFEAADSLRIESGYVLFGREISGNEAPAELGLGRLDERRSVKIEPKRRLVGLEILERPSSASARTDLPHARVTSEGHSPILRKRIALGYASPPAARAGTLVRLGDGRLACVARLPFYDPGRRLPRATPL